MIRAIDIHTHFFPDAVAARAIPQMEESSGWKTCHDGTLSGLLGSMDAAGVETSIVLPVATNLHKVGSVNRFSASIDNGRIVMAGALHPGSPAWRDDLEEMLMLGFRAVKLHPDYQGFTVDDPKMLPFFANLRDAGVTVIFHAGADPSYQPPFGAPPVRIASLLDNLPGMQVHASHMGGFQHIDEVEQCLAGRENVVMDTSFSFGFIPDQRIRALIEAHGVERIMFGTDSPWLDQTEQAGNVVKLGLGDRETEMILYSNARAMLDGWKAQGGRNTGDKED